MRIRIRAARFTFLALAAALPAAGCHTLRPSTPISVNVRDAETHAPVPDATVRLWRFGAHESDRESAFTAGPDGVAHARLAPPDVGGVMVEVTGPNCLSAQVPLPRAVADALATAKPLQPYKGPPLSVDVDVFAGPRPKVERLPGLIRPEREIRPPAFWAAASACAMKGLARWAPDERIRPGRMRKPSSPFMTKIRTSLQGMEITAKTWF